MHAAVTQRGMGVMVVGPAAVGVGGTQGTQSRSHSEWWFKVYP